MTSSFRDMKGLMEMSRKPNPYETTPEVFVILGRGEDDALVVQSQDGACWRANPAQPKKTKKRKNLTYRIELPLGAYEDLRVQVGLVRRDGGYPEVVVRSSQDIYDVMRPMSNVPQEVLSAICLSADNSINGIAEIARGGITGTAIDPRVLAQYAVLTNAVSIILVHNHPSGNPKASAEDVMLTQHASELLRRLGVTLLDHVIVGKTGYTSFADEGML
jgi:DNA repair protein RadC